MAKKVPVLEDLTKSELIEIIRQRLFYAPSPKEIAWIIYERKMSQAQKEMNAALEKIEQLSGKTSMAKVLAAHDEWEKAFRKSEAADAEWKRISG